MQYHRIVSDPTNHAIGCARSTLRALHTRGSCSPRNCLLSKNASSTLQRRQYPLITNAAEALGSVATSASSRHCPGHGLRIDFGGGQHLEEVVGIERADHAFRPGAAPQRRLLAEQADDQAADGAQVRRAVAVLLAGGVL